MSEYVFVLLKNPSEALFFRALASGINTFTAPEKGDGYLSCEAPKGRWRQKVPVTFSPTFVFWQTKR